MSRTLDSYLYEQQLLSLIEQTKLDRELMKNEIKQLFPSIVNKVVGNIQMILPIATGKMPDEEKMVKKYIKNLDISVNLNNDTGRNAYTYPSFTKNSATILNALGQIPFMTPIIYMLHGVHYAGKNQHIFDAAREGKDRTIIFPENMLDVHIFVTKGLFANLDDPLERMAIYLHEIGHWANIKSSVFDVLTGSITALMKLGPMVAILGVMLGPIVFILGVIAMLFARKAEYGSDAFATRLGYGQELKSALYKFMDVRVDANIIDRIEDTIIHIILKIQNFVEKIVPIMGHPSMDKRASNIDKVEGMTNEQWNSYYSDLVLTEKYIREGIISDKVYEFIKPLCLKLDSMLAPHASKLFPQPVK